MCYKNYTINSQRKKTTFKKLDGEGEDDTKSKVTNNVKLCSKQILEE